MRKKYIYKKETFIWEQMFLLSHAKLNRVILKKCNVKEKLTLYKR